MEGDFLSFTASKNQLIKDNRGGAAAVFAMALFAAACIFVPYMIIDGGYFTFFGDFNVQQIPFYQLCHDAIRNGEWGWNFGTDLGANFIGSYTFYNITSPFFWLTIPFPNSWVPYFMGPLFILKFACAALTAFLYIRRFTRRKETAQVGALLYAFSGFSIYNIFFNHFHEAIVFFPLLLLAFELLMTENKRGVFALAVMVCAVVNYFFFVGMLVFGIIYFAVRLISHAIKPRASQIFALFFEAIVGILLAAFILLPSYLAISGNGRVTEMNLGWNSIFFGKESIYGNVLEVFFFPPDLPARPVMFPEADVKWSSLGAWMPIFSMVGVFAYCGAKNGNWLKRIIITCAVMAFVPILNSAFYLFNDSYYVRWFFMPILMMALATAIAIEDREISWNSGFKRVGLITLIITLVIGFFPQTTDESVIIGLFTEPKNPMYIARFWVTCAIALGGLVVLATIIKMRKDNLEKFLRFSILSVLIMSVGYANFFVASGKSHSYTHTAVVDNLIEGKLELEGDPDTFRIDTFACMDNAPMFLGYSSINAFHSIVPSSIMEFYEFIGEKRDVASRPDVSKYAIRSLLSVKYLINQDGEDRFTEDSGNTKMPGFEYLYNSEGFDVYENINYIGYGFSYDAYLSFEEAEKMGNNVRANSMLRAIILDKAQINKYGHLLTPYDKYCAQPGNTDSNSYFDLKIEAARRNETAAISFKTGKNSFTAVVERDRENLVFFSIPYDEGWSATVNGKAVPVEKVNIGFMAVPVGEGRSEIVFTYKTPGLSAGAVITLSAAAILTVYLLIIFFYRRKSGTTIPEYPEGDSLIQTWSRDITAELLEREEAAQYIEFTEESDEKSADEENGDEQ